MSIPELVDSDTGKLNKNRTVQYAYDGNETLFKLLLSAPDFKEKFFKKVGEAVVFDTKNFMFFIDQKQFLPDSYTAFANKIGLSVGNKYLHTNKDVVLNFPYKDCYLEGGMTAEDKGRKEIFFNNILAQDEITQLLEPKVLTNKKVYGKPIAEKLTDNNLIIKGNNLCALHSLKKQFIGKVKLIYIDPPYNTGNDGFKYNDSFNHSTWLVFMKNRLEIARELLREDGVIFVQCDDNEQAYLKVLMDEVFGRENFITNFIWKGKSGGANDSRYVAIDHEYILCYSKNAIQLFFNLDKDANVTTSYNLEDEKGKYALDRLDKQSIRYSKSLDYEIKDNEGNSYFPKHKDKNNPNATWRWGKETIKERYDELVFKDGNVYTKNYQKEGAIPRSLLLDERFSRTRTGKTEHFALFERTIFNNPKPENLMKFIIEISTEENDLVLDFFSGSGTTAAVAHKMGRQYIGIEQMDYIENITIERLKKVIDGEQGGISKAMNWQGGGSFIYFELKKYNQHFEERLTAAKNTEDLLALWNDIREKSFLCYNVDISALDADLRDAESEFMKLDLNKQIQVIMGLLDKNQIYVNLSSLEDVDFVCTDSEKALTNDFYGGK